MKTRYKLYNAILLILFSFIWISCRNLFDTKQNYVSGEKVTVTFSSSTEARTVNPDFSVSSLKNITIKATPAGSSEITIVSNVSYAQLMTSSYQLYTGVYNFYATAEINEYKFTSTVCDKEIVNGPNNIQLVFVPFEQEDVLSGAGDIKVTISLGAEVKNVYKVTASLKKYSDDSVVVAETAIIPAEDKYIFAKTGIETGAYILEYKFYGESHQEVSRVVTENLVQLGSHMELVNVSKNKLSSAEREIKEVNEMYKISYNLDGGTLTDAETYFISYTKGAFGNTGKYSLPGADKLSKQDHIFIKWIDEEDSTETALTEISDSEFRDIKLKAVWKFVRYNIDWKTNTIGDNKTLYQFAKDSKSIVFGKTTDYASNVASLTPMHCGETSDDYVTAYYDSSNQKLYVLADEKIVFEDDDSELFNNCNLLTSITLNNIDTSNMTDMSNLFRDCQNLITLDLSNLDISNVNNMSFIFCNCYRLTNLTFPTDFTCEKVINMSYMFSHCESFTSINLSSFNTKKLQNTNYMFYACNNITSINFGNNFDTSKVTSMISMFSQCNKLTVLDLSKFNTSNVTSMANMFSYCYQLKNLDLTSFDTRKVTGMHYMFDNSYSLESINLSSFNTSNVTDMGKMFYRCNKLKTLILGSNFDTSKVTDMQYMFANCSVIESLDLSNFNTSNVTNMMYMFNSCKEIKTLDLTSFNTEKAENMAYMFYYCQKLSAVDLSSFDTTKVSNVINMFGYDTTTVLYGDNITKGTPFTACTENTTFGNGVSITWVYKGPISGSVAVSGDNLVGKTLTATYTPGRTGETVTYQWYRVNPSNSSETKISGATYSTYILTASDENMKIKVVATGSGNFYGNKENFLREGIKIVSKYNLNWKDSIDDNGIETGELKKIIFGYTTDYTSDIEGLAPMSFSNSDSELIYGYYNDSDQYLYVLSDADIFAGNDLSFWFYSNVEEIIFENINTSEMTKMNNMFGFCGNLLSLNLTKFDTSKVTNMNGMFKQCTKLASVDVSSFDTSKVTDMSLMFGYNDNITTITLSPAKFKTDKVTSMLLMFYGCEKLTFVDTSNFKANAINNTESMFDCCYALTVIDLSNFDMSASSAGTVSMHGMFKTCKALTTIYVPAGTDWSGSKFRENDTNNYMFKESTKLKGGNNTDWDASYINKARAKVDGLNGEAGYFSVKP